MYKEQVNIYLVGDSQQDISAREMEREGEGDGE